MRTKPAVEAKVWRMDEWGVVYGTIALMRELRRNCKPFNHQAILMAEYFDSRGKVFSVQYVFPGKLEAKVTSICRRFPS